MYSRLLPVVFLFMGIPGVMGQDQKPLLLSEAIQTGIRQYPAIQAKKNYLQAANAIVQDTRNQYLPNIITSIQQAYGSINGQYGPLLAAEGMGIASSGPVTNSQRWDAGFGSLYLVNTNWELFTFGRVRSRIELATALARKDSADLAQEEFIQGVKIAGAYLNLLAAQRFSKNAEANLQRAVAVQQTVIARTRNGLNAGVDSSIANAEVSRARLVVIDARNTEQQIGNLLAQLLNVPPTAFILDSSFIQKIPAEFNTALALEQNPQVRYYRQRINESNLATRYLRKSIAPGINLFGIFQARGSGFGYDYTAANNYKYSASYLDGLKPVRANYITGLALAWNIISPIKIRQQVRAQQFITDAYKNEYDQITMQLKDQLIFSDQRIENSLQVVREVPLQYQAAFDAYVQKSVLYKNGLTTIIDLQQALFALSRAETDRSVSYINVWQALLLKAAASGDFDLFTKQVQ